MPSWQIAYHLIFLLVSIIVFLLLRRRRIEKYGVFIVLLPPAMAVVAEVIINTIWPEMLASSSTAGVGVVIAWMINTLLGMVAGVLVQIYPDRK